MRLNSGTLNGGMIAGNDCSLNRRYLATSQRRQRQSYGCVVVGRQVVGRLPGAAVPVDAPRLDQPEGARRCSSSLVVVVGGGSGGGGRRRRRQRRRAFVFVFARGRRLGHFGRRKLAGLVGVGSGTTRTHFYALRERERESAPCPDVEIVEETMKTFDEEQGGAGGERLGRFDVVANTNLQIKLVDRLFLLESRFFFFVVVPHLPLDTLDGSTVDDGHRLGNGKIE